MPNVNQPLFRNTFVPTFRNVFGPQPSFEFNGLAGQLHPAMNVARASTATNINPVGTMVEAGINVARFEHNPATLAPRGLLVEGSRTNLLFPSDGSSTTPTTWQYASASGIAPDVFKTSINGLQVKKYIPNTTNTIHFLQPARNAAGTDTSTISYVSGTTYTFSFDAHIPSGEASANIILEAPNGGAFSTSFGNAAQNTFNVQNGTYTGGFAGCSIRPLNNGWYRVTKTVTANASATGRAFPSIFWSAYANTTGNDANGVFIARCQTEVGSSETSYIPTTTTAVTRSQVSVSIPISATGINPLSMRGAILARVRINGGDNTLFAAMVSLNDGTTSNEIYAGVGGSGNGTPVAISRKSGGVNGDIFGTANSWTIGSVKTLVVSWDVGVLNFYIDGAKIGTDTTVDIASNFTQLTLGRRGAGNTWFYNFERVVAYNYCPTDAQAQALTAQ